MRRRKMITTTCKRCPLYENGKCAKDDSDKNGDSDYCAYGIFARQIRAIQYYAYGNYKVKEQAKKVIRDCYIDLLEENKINSDIPIVDKKGNYKGSIPTGTSDFDKVYDKAKELFGGTYKFGDIL